jgi:hypothetical protein
MGAAILDPARTASNPVRGVKMSDPENDIPVQPAEAEQQPAPRKLGNLEFKVSQKGAASVYGLGRFPVTLYYEQWIRLLEAADRLRTFLEENKSQLKLKDTAK